MRRIWEELKSIPNSEFNMATGECLVIIILKIMFNKLQRKNFIAL